MQKVKLAPLGARQGKDRASVSELSVNSQMPRQVRVAGSKNGDGGHTDGRAGTFWESFALLLVTSSKPNQELVLVPRAGYDAPQQTPGSTRCTLSPCPGISLAITTAILAAHRAEPFHAWAPVIPQKNLC